MVTAQVLTDGEQDAIESKLEEFSTLDTDGSIMSYLYENDALADGDVEVRFFPMGEDQGEEGPVESIYFEVSVDKDASWHEDLGAYSADNLRNGGPLYETLADELEGVVERVMGTTPAFVMQKGSGAFTAEVSV